MLHRILSCWRGVLLFVAMGAVAVSLDDYVWQSRLLFVVAPEDSDPAVQQVRDSLAYYASEVADRDLRVLQLFITGQSLMGDRPISAGQARHLRAELGVEAGDALLVLVGKDGGVKRRAPLSTDLRDIFRQIDAMPMRRQETRDTEVGS
jgi:hypothetical protein